jgi:isopenicillin N synthase-like dioxygenase
MPQSLTAEIYSSGLSFFEQSLERKLAWASNEAHQGPAGYIRLFGETVGKTRGGAYQPDVSESLSFAEPAAQGGLDGRRWPQTPPGLPELAKRYALCACDLGHRLMRLSALALDLPEDYFEPFYSPMSHLLRLAYYPEQLADPAPGQLRNAAHTDFGGFTILRQDDAPGGLQVLTPNGDWIDVPATPGALVINTGDLIQRWTNDRWISNLHRVVNPPRHHNGPTRRLSIVMFTGPRPDAEIACLPTCQTPERPARYAPTLASDHINLKLAQTYGSPETEYRA